MEDDKNWTELNRKLDVLIKLMAYQVISDKTVTHAAPILKRLGLTPEEIGTLFGTTAQTVRVRLSESKTRKSGKKPKSK